MVLLVGLALLVVSIVILCCVPPVSKDALTHHLAIPKLYLKHGGIYEIPAISFSYYPMNLDLLYLIPLYFGNDIIPKFIHFAFALLSAIIIFRYVKRRTGTVYGLLGALFFLSVPIIVKLAISVYVDLGLIFFSTASLLLLLKWAEGHFRIKFLALSAAFCGLAMGTKYNGLITLLLLTLFAPFIYSRTHQGEKFIFFHSVCQGLIFSTIALLVFSPWMARNYRWTKNPVYPLYDQVFNPDNGQIESPVGPVEFRSRIHHESWWQMALLPVRVFFQGQDGSPRYFDGKLNPFLLLFPFLAFFQFRNDSQVLRREKKIFIAFAGLLFSFVLFCGSMRIRYITPIIPPLVMLSVFGVKKAFDIIEDFGSPTGKKIARAVFALVVFFFLLQNAVYVLTQFRNVRPFDYLNGRLTRDDYIEIHRPEYAVMRYIKVNLPADARILFIFMGNRGYYCDREYVYDMVKHKSTLRQLVMRSDKPEKITRGLKGMGISHLLINHNIFDQWVASNFTTKDRALLGQFIERTVEPLFFKWGYGLIRVGELQGIS